MAVENIEEQVLLQGDLFRLFLPNEGVIVTITLRADQEKRLLCNCDSCDTLCEHIGAALSLILDSKTALGLAKAPVERVPLEPLSETELIQQAIADRQLRAKEEKMTVQAVDADSKSPWSDYIVTSKLSGKTYRVALRGVNRGDSYCSCPDFRTNTLGTCKHILHALQKLKRRFEDADFRKKPKQKETSIYLRYGTELALRLGAPDRAPESTTQVIGPLKDVDISDVGDLLQRIDKLEGLGESVVVYPDAEEFIQQQLFRQRMTKLVAQIRKDPANHPLRKELLKIELLPYQMDGIAFVTGAGRAVLADDMGLGKTIQGVGVAELLAREVGIERVLVICPTSLKSQWKNEIRRFCDRSSQIVMGRADERTAQYSGGAFFTICNYEQVLKDIMDIERSKWDLIILDEGQRIKNWEAQTTRIIKSLQSRFALVLSGTPLENRLDELYSVVQFIDGRHLGPGFRFFNRYRVTDEKGKILGYKHLDELFEQLFVDGDHKAVVFSEWTRMLDLIEPLLTKRGVKFVRLEGKIPQSQRSQIVSEFQNNPDCKVFLSTNAGSTGLNLQQADTVVNVDLPWNPAILEQRISRAHRMGQKNPVNVFILVTEETLEEQLLTTISQKKELAMAALDYESDISEIDLQSGMDELKSRLEILLGAVPEGYLDESQKSAKQQEAAQLQRREKVADAGGQMLTAAFSFLTQMLPDSGAVPSTETVDSIRTQLAECAETDDQGRKSLRINLPNEDALQQFAQSLAKLMSFAK